jgi:hypothetical protein
MRMACTAMGLCAALMCTLPAMGHCRCDMIALSVDDIVQSLGSGELSQLDLAVQIQDLDPYQLDDLAMALQQTILYPYGAERLAAQEHPVLLRVLPIVGLVSAVCGATCAIKAGNSMHHRWTAQAFKSVLPQQKDAVVGVGNTFLADHYAVVQKELWASEKPFWFYAGGGYAAFLAAIAVSKALEMLGVAKVLERWTAAFEVVVAEQERRAEQQQQDMPEPAICPEYPNGIPPEEPVLDPEISILPVETVEPTVQPVEPSVTEQQTTPADTSESVVQPGAPDATEQLSDHLSEQLTDQEKAPSVVAPTA